MTTQVQIRGATQATQEARTLASRELDINTTDKRLAVHDGSTTGGIPHATCFDVQNQEWTYAAASGTDAITVTMARPPSAYAAGQKFSFKAANTNTGSATLNVNSLGAKTIKKVSGGVLVTLAAGDIVQNAIYECTYDGTSMLLSATGGGGGCELIDEVALSGINLSVVPLDAKAYKSIKIDFANISVSGAEYTTNHYRFRRTTFTGVSGGAIQGNYHEESSLQGEFSFSESAGCTSLNANLWLNNLDGIDTHIQGTMSDNNQDFINFLGIVNTSTPAPVTDFQIGRTGSNNFGSNSIMRVWGYL
jgi:hypothetical protein